MKVVTVPKYILLLLILFLLSTSVAIGVLFFKTDISVEPVRKEMGNLDVEEKCLEEDPQNILWQNIKSIEKTKKNNSSDIVAIIQKYNENNELIGDCKFYLTNYIEDALGILNSNIDAVINIVYFNSAKIAYQYHDVIFVQRIEKGAKAVVVADNSLASKTSLNEAGEKLLFGGPFLIDDNELSGIANHGRFVFTVNFTYSCESPSSKRSCSEAIELSNELKEKRVLGLWLYEDSGNGRVVHLSSELE